MSLNGAAAPPSHAEGGAAPQAVRRVGEFVIAGLIIAVSIRALSEPSVNIPAGSRVGPTVFPIFVGALLLCAGAAVFIGVVRGRVGTPEESEDTDPNASTDWLTMAKIAALVVAELLLMEPIGRGFRRRCCSAASPGRWVRSVGGSASSSASSSPWSCRSSSASCSASPSRSGRCSAGSARSSEALMDNINLLMEGFATALQPQYIVFAFLGVLVGTAVGVLPGIGPAMTVALLLPLTYTLDPTAALITFAGIYYGAMYGGSTTSILLNTPGESASIITAIEGHGTTGHRRHGYRRTLLHPAGPGA